MKKMKKALSLLLTVIFVMSLSISAFANEVKSTEQIPSPEYSSEIKSAEQSVLDFFAAVQNNDYGALNRVSMDKHISDAVRRNTLELHQEEALFAEKITILSSEKCSEDMVMVSVSYVMDGKEYLMTYPVVLVDNRWVVNVGDGVDPSVTGVFSASIVPETDNSIESKIKWNYDFTFNVGRWYMEFYILDNSMKAYIIGDQNNSKGDVNVSYAIVYKNAYNTWMPTGDPGAPIFKNNTSVYQEYKDIKGPVGIQLAVETGITRSGTRVWGNIYDGP